MPNASPVGMMAAVRKQLRSDAMCTCRDTAAQRTAASDDEPPDAGRSAGLKRLRGSNTQPCHLFRHHRLGTKVPPCRPRFSVSKQLEEPMAAHCSTGWPLPVSSSLSVIAGGGGGGLNLKKRVRTDLITSSYSHIMDISSWRWRWIPHTFTEERDPVTCLPPPLSPRGAVEMTVFHHLLFELPLLWELSVWFVWFCCLQLPRSFVIASASKPAR